MQIGPFHAQLAPGFDPSGLAGALEILPARLRDRADHPGLSRHRLVRLSLPSPAGPVDVMVKAFAAQPAWKDRWDQRRGSKAMRAFRVAVHLHERGVGTPPPVACLERWDGARLAESYMVTRFVEPLTDLRRALIHIYREDPHCARLMALLQAVADAVRSMHEAGVLHRDLGNQNILLHGGLEGDVLFTDLNRARILPRLGERERARDISRLTLPSDLLRVFKEMYWSGPPPAAFERWERLRRAHYRWHDQTRALRHPFRERARRGRTPLEETYPSVPEIWIWDDRSAQPIQVARGPERRKHMPVANVLRPAAATLRRLAPIRRAYREFLRGAFQTPQTLDQRVGVCVEPAAGAWQERLDWLRQLGACPVLVRCYRHHDEARRETTLNAIRQLRALGHDVTVALVQDRASVRDPDLWAGFGSHVLDSVAADVQAVEVGHAINRVKWGVWDLRELRGLYAPLPEWRRRHPQLQWIGPACIDFEYPAVLAALDLLPEGATFDALSHHLYVDRRGAPEARQGRFSTLEKFALGRAMARVHPRCADRFICSEVNWPVLGTGVHSPVGSPYHWPGQVPGPPNVTPEAYAAYMIRYLLIALCSGLAERVYWWRLAAHGFGLLSDAPPGTFERRPAFGALRTFLAVCGPARFESYQRWGRGGHSFRFAAPDGEPFLVAYTTEDREPALPAWRCGRVIDAQGVIHKQSQADLLGAAPIYLMGCEQEGA